MLFKKKEKKEGDIFYKPKVKRFYKLRQWVLSFLLVLGCIGGLSSLARNANSKIDESLEEQQFLYSFVENYYSYPRDEQQKKFVNEFMLDSTWDISIPKNTEKVEVKDITIKQVETLKKHTTYYFTASLLFTTILEDESKQESWQVVNEKVDVVRDSNHAYIVASALQPFVISYMPFEVEEKNKLVMEYKEGTSKVEDTEKQIIIDLISLFLETYNTSYEQALLFCDELELEYKDSEVNYKFQKLKSASRDSSNYYVSANVEEGYSHFTANRMMYFVIDVSKQKIKQIKIM